MKKFVTGCNRGCNSCEGGKTVCNVGVTGCNGGVTGCNRGVTGETGPQKVRGLICHQIDEEPNLPGPNSPHQHFQGAQFAGAQYAGAQLARAQFAAKNRQGPNLPRTKNGAVTRCKGGQGVGLQGPRGLRAGPTRR